MWLPMGFAGSFVNQPTNEFLFGIGGSTPTLYTKGEEVF